MNIIDTLENLQRFETHEVDGLGTVNILKPTLTQAKSFEDFAKELGDDDGMDGVIKQAEKIALEYVVNDKGEFIFNSENIHKLTDAPLDIVMGIISAFMETFSRINNSAESIEKKLTAPR